MLDGLLPAGYTLLDVGCGTGGYHRLLRNYGRIVGLDFSREMITLANDLKVRHGLAGVEYRAERFEGYQADAPFDIVNLVGVYGWYVPWHGHSHILHLVTGMLKQDGVACFAYVPPRSVLGFVKSLIFPGKTVNVRKTVIYKMLKAAGFSPLLELGYPHATVVIAKKNVHGA